MLSKEVEHVEMKYKDQLGFTESTENHPGAFRLPNMQIKLYTLNLAGRQLR